MLAIILVVQLNAIGAIDWIVCLDVVGVSSAFLDIGFSGIIDIDYSWGSKWFSLGLFLNMWSELSLITGKKTLGRSNRRCDVMQNILFWIVTFD